MKHKIMDVLGTVCLVCALFLGVHAVLSVPGCLGSDPTTKQAAYMEAVALIDASADEVNRLQQIPDKTPEEVAALAKANATISMLQEKLQLAVDAEGNFDEVKGLQLVTDFIPPPYNVLSSLLIGSIGTWLKGAKTRGTFKSLVEALNTVKEDDPMLASALSSNKGALNAAMGTKATAVLTVARKDGKFPVV